MSSITPAPPSLPNLKSLYGRDLTIRRAANTFGFMLFAAVGIRWATEPARSGTTPPGVDFSFEVAAGTWGPIGALVFAALAALVLARRYLWVKKVLTQGITVQATVENLEIFSTNPDYYENRGGKPAPQRFYYATVRYAVHGVERTVELKMPNSGFVYGLVKGRATELIVLDWVPDRPLIRSVYLGRV